MSQNELVDAFMDGRISRRTLIRRLVAGGVSAGAAMSYAHLLEPGRADAATSAAGDFYDPEAEILSKSLNAVVNRGHLRVEVEVSFPGSVKLLAKVRHQGKLRTVALKQVAFQRPNDRVVRMPLTRAGRNILRGRKQAKVILIANAVDRYGHRGSDRDVRKLR